MDGATARIDGLDQAIKELYALAPSLRDRVLKGMCATGASVLRQEAISRAPEYTEEVSKGHPPGGTLKKAIYQARLVDKCTATQEVWAVDVRRGKKFQATGKAAVNRDAFYASWVEFGHYTRVPKAMTKTAKAAGRALGVASFVPPHPFMRPAFELKKSAALQAMQEYAQKHLAYATEMNRFLKAA